MLKTDGNVTLDCATESDILEAADKALETVTNVGNTDLSNVMSAVATVEAGLDAKLNASTVHIVETWVSGTEWYRKWSDGWIEQGGVTPKLIDGNQHTITFQKPFSDTNYTAIMSTRPNDSEQTMGQMIHFDKTKTATSINYSRDGWTESYIGVIGDWCACGY